MDKQQESKNSWCDDIPKTDYELEPMKPKALLNVIDVLKQQNISTIKMKFSFPNEYQKKEFLKSLKEEENDQYFRQVGKKEPGKFSEIKKRGTLKKGCIFYIGSRIKSEIFIQAYRQKLDQFQKSENVKIYQLAADIYIQSEKKVGAGTIFYSQMMAMHKKLKIAIFFNEQALLETVINSEYFKNRLLKVGISSYAKPNRNKHVAFYSQDFEPEEIKVEVLKHYSYQPRVLKLDDVQLSDRDNLRIFDLVFKSIRSTIEQLRQVYEGDLQINKNRSCFVLHLKHKAFQEEPVALISKVVSHLFIMSFPLRHSRSFINFLRRDAKKYPFIIATHYNNIAFCCINRTKIKEKKDLLQIFAPFLQQLQPKSKLTIHLKPNCVLQQNSQMPKMILDLTDECGVDVDDYQKVIQYQKFNIIVRPKNFNSELKKTKKKMEFGNFLLKLLLLEQKYQQMTEDELNQSILNRSVLEQNMNEQEKRRGKMRNGRESTNKNIQKKTQVKKENVKQAPVRARGNRVRGEQRNEKEQAKKEENKEQKEKDDSCCIQKSEYSNILEAQSQYLKNQQNGSELQMNYIEPEQLLGGQGFKKGKKDKQIQETLSQKHGIQVKAWKLKVNRSIYNISEENEKKLMKQKCFLVKNLNQKENYQQNVAFIQFSDLQIQQIGYLIYKSSDQKYWIPTHMIQRF